MKKKISDRKARSIFLANAGASSNWPSELWAVRILTHLSEIGITPGQKQLLAAILGVSYSQIENRIDAVEDRWRQIEKMLNQKGVKVTGVKEVRKRVSSALSLITKSLQTYPHRRISPGDLEIYDDTHGRMAIR